MLPELIHVGHKYRTVAGDTVEIAERVAGKDEERKHVHTFGARVLSVIAGHEALMGQVMKYDGEGRWISPEGVSMLKGIHNLHEEACCE